MGELKTAAGKAPAAVGRVDLLEFSHHEIAPAWAGGPPTPQCDLVM